MLTSIPLHFENFDVRTVMINGELWWVGIDATNMLGISKGHQALSRLDDYERGTYIIGTPLGGQEMVIINESGMYSLLLTSRKPIAKTFKRWLTTEVLPSIRQHGCYPSPPPKPKPVIDDEIPWDGGEKTIGQRFREERERWEAETGYKMAGTIPGISKHVARAIEDDMGGIRKGQRMEMLLYAGIDVLYIMTGRRTLTRAERAMRDAYRLADHEQRTLILNSTLALPRAEDVEGDDW